MWLASTSAGALSPACRQRLKKAPKFLGVVADSARRQPIHLAGDQEDLEAAVKTFSVIQMC